MGHSPEKKFPLNGEDYELYEEIGEGISATVYKALCVPLNVIVAIKVLDLEKCNNDLDGIRREVQTMNLIDHANVLRAYCSFTAGSKLWVVMPYMAGGSCLHIMKSSHPEGFEEPIIATLLREVLKALVYLHAHGHIHRDVKAGNILIDSNGAVKLADFGVSACMFDTGDRQRSRNTFVGTPCWMAPEVMQQVHGYDFKADIWSFGITALELAHGHAPFSKYPPMKVLLMTLQNAPPGLDYERDKKFSKSFKEMVGACLVKDPKKRPTSEKLLKHRFFDYACSNEYLARRILRGLCPLGERFRILKSKEDDLVVQNKANYGDKEHISQREYIRGISGWNFNTEDLKSQAALIQEDEGILSIEEIDVNHKQKYGFDDATLEPDKLSPTASSQSSVALAQEEEMNNHQNARTSFSISPLESLGDSFDIREGDTIMNIPKGKDSTRLESRRPLPLQVSPRGVDKETRKNDNEILERSFSMPTHVIFGESDKSISGPLTSKNSISPPKIAENNNGYRESVQPKTQPMRNYSGTMLYCQTSNLAVEDTSESTVKCKGRFKVTSDLSPKAPPTIMATPLLMSLQSICKQSEVQKNDVAKLIRSVQAEINDGGTSDLSQVSPTSAKDRVLEVQMANLEQSFQNIVAELHGLRESNQEHSYRNIVAELHELKESNLQLVKQVGAFEKQLNALVKKENEKEKEGSVKKK